VVSGPEARVIKCCARINREKHGETWITGEMVEAYCRLHRLGFAHSVESWCEGRLVGGLYGVALGGAFFGESMFNKVSDASKVAFEYLARRLRDERFQIIDCQVPTEHLKSLGAREIPRREFMEILRKAMNPPLAARKKF
jgi:leucyl/phenylalanyl-tRNA--protein transferase